MLRNATLLALASLAGVNALTNIDICTKWSERGKELLEKDIISEKESILHFQQIAAEADYAQVMNVGSKFKGFSSHLVMKLPEWLDAKTGEQFISHLQDAVAALPGFEDQSRFALEDKMFQEVQGFYEDFLADKVSGNVLIASVARIGQVAQGAVLGGNLSNPEVDFIYSIGMTMSALMEFVQIDCDKLATEFSLPTVTDIEWDDDVVSRFIAQAREDPSLFIAHLTHPDGDSVDNVEDGEAPKEKKKKKKGKRTYRKDREDHYVCDALLANFVPPEEHLSTAADKLVNIYTIEQAIVRGYSIPNRLNQRDYLARPAAIFRNYPKDLKAIYAAWPRLASDMVELGKVLEEEVLPPNDEFYVNRLNEIVQNMYHGAEYAKGEDAHEQKAFLDNLAKDTIRRLTELIRVQQFMRSNVTNRSRSYKLERARRVRSLFAVMHNPHNESADKLKKTAMDACLKTHFPQRSWKIAKQLLGIEEADSDKPAPPSDDANKESNDDQLVDLEDDDTEDVVPQSDDKDVDSTEAETDVSQDDAEEQEEVKEEEDKKEKKKRKNQKKKGKNGKKSHRGRGKKGKNKRSLSNFSKSFNIRSVTE